jgi:drug/metabolite transporter (DMT)-like permease
MVKLLLLGTAAAFFFSSTFILNRWLAVDGGSWFWTATLRYVYVFLLLTLVLALRRKKTTDLRSTVRCFAEAPSLWLISGGVGFATFYLLLCYAAQFAPGWVIASTWQITILMTPLVFVVLRMDVPYQSVTLLVSTFVGVVIINVAAIEQAISHSINSVLCVALSGFCYPLGNTIVGLAKKGGHPWVPQIVNPAIEDVFARMWLMTIGAMPILLLVGLLLRPGAPTPGQLAAVFYVAVSTGVIATGLLLKAWHMASNTREIAAVAATQALEIPFALAIGLLFFSEPLPNLTQMAGVAIVIISVILFPVITEAKKSPDLQSK